MNEQINTKRFYQKWWFWVLLPFIIILLLLGLDFLIQKLPAEKLPQLQASFVNLDYVDNISVFRSCDGHVKLPAVGDEPASNMGYYYYLKEGTQSQDVPIYSPYDGYLYISEGGKVLEIYTHKKNFSHSWFFYLDHVQPAEGINNGQQVKAGQLIAYPAPHEGKVTSFDVLVGRLMTFPRTIQGGQTPWLELDSVFNYMPDDIFALYKSKGITSRDQMIVSKEYRQSHPCQFQPNSIYFVQPNKGNNSQIQDSSNIPRIPPNTCPDRPKEGQEAEVFIVNGQKYYTQEADMEWINKNCPNYQGQ